MTRVEYDANLERLLKEEGEKCESLSILHRLAHEKYNSWSNAINIPVIVGSSAVGFATGIKIDYDDINIVLGILSVVIGCIKALDSFFQLAQRSERHRIVSLQYAQICRKIAVELALDKGVRMEAKDALNIIRTDIKNLEEISPIIPDDIITIYNTKYPKHANENIKRPNITNGLTEIMINPSVVGYFPSVAPLQQQNSRRPSVAESNVVYLPNVTTLEQQYTTKTDLQPPTLTTNAEIVVINVGEM